METAKDNGLGGGAIRADVRTHLQGSRVILKLRARGLDADTEYVLLCKDDEGATDSAELARFTSRSNGSANLTQNLAKTDDPEAPADPRGKFLVIARVIADGAEPPTEIVGGWLYGVPQDDGPKTKIKEVTDLAADGNASPSGNVAARYDMRPNGHGKLSISMRHVPAGNYEILVDIDETPTPVASFTPNRAGNAKVDFQTRPIRGQGSGKVKLHRKKKHLSFDPRRKEILVQLAADPTDLESEPTPMFSGPMIAQIEGLNTCSPTSTDWLLEEGTDSGVATLELQENCETAFEVKNRERARGDRTTSTLTASTGTGRPRPSASTSRTTVRARSRVSCASIRLRTRVKASCRSTSRSAPVRGSRCSTREQSISPTGDDCRPPVLSGGLLVDYLVAAKGSAEPQPRVASQTGLSRNRESVLRVAAEPLEVSVIHDVDAASVVEHQVQLVAVVGVLRSRDELGQQLQCVDRGQRRG